MEKYDKVRVIGSGSFGRAWLSLRADTGRRCVLKEIQVMSLSERSRKQALTEVTVLARCKHINVIRYKEAFVHNSALWIAMEYADGGDLYTHIREQPSKTLPQATILDWFIQICFALQYLHNRSIIHRDLKTQNIFLTSCGVLKVGDLGIARILKHSEAHANTAVGTPYYLSPEICKREPYDYKTDMWAAGCVVYEMCTGRRPFQTEHHNFSTLVLHIIQGKYKPLPQGSSPIVEDLVRVLLKVNPESRPSADQTLAIPTLQPYIKTYIRRTRTIRDHSTSTPSKNVQRERDIPLKPHRRALGRINRQATPLPPMEKPDNPEEIERPATPVPPHERPATPLPDENPPTYLPNDQRSPKIIPRRKASLSTPRPSPLMAHKRAAQSAKAARNTENENKPVRSAPVVSLYHEVLRKRQPLATLGTSNTPTPRDALGGTPGSPVAHRTRKRSSPDAGCKYSQDALQNDVYMCHLLTCTPHVTNAFSNMETVRDFLESRLGGERFVELLNKVRAEPGHHLDMSLICPDRETRTCFPLVVHLLQLEHLSKLQ